jgi:hypothetical protein
MADASMLRGVAVAMAISVLLTALIAVIVFFALRQRS